MNKKFLVLYILIISLLFSGCTSTLCDNQDYKIFKENEKWFIQFYKDYEQRVGQYEVSVPKFDSATEMSKTISTGNAPYYSMLSIHAWARREPFEIVDPTRWYELSLPQYRSLQKIHWRGQDTIYYVNGYDSEEDNPAGFQYSAQELITVSILKKEKYEEKLQKAFPDMAKVDYSLKSYEKVSYRNAAKCVYNKGINQPDYYTVFRYEYETPEGIRYVTETFDIDEVENTQKNDTELTAPGNYRDINIYWTDGFGYFWLEATTNIPVTDEWLQAFQMTPITD